MAKLRLALFAVLAAAGTAWIALTAPLGGDYPGPPCKTCDYAAPPIQALAHGHLGRFFDTQTVMGSFSLLLRAPSVWLAHIGPHSLRWEYRLGCLICLMVVAFLAVWLMDLMRRDGRGWFLQLLIAALLIAGPTTIKALYWGRPEEPLGGALCVIALLLASRGAPLAAGTALGFAIATKPWALLAAVPVVLAAKDRRVATLAMAAGAAALLTVPMLIGDPSRFWTMMHTYSVNATSVTPANIWWPFGREMGITITPHATQGTFGVPHWIASVAHPTVTMLAIVLGAAFWLSRRDTFAERSDGERASDALQLLALILLLRCVLDPGTYSYYHAPFMIALIASEALSKKRLPYLALISTGALWLLNSVVAVNNTPDSLHNLYLLWAGPTALYLVLAIYSPSVLRRPLDRRRGARSPAAAQA